MWVAHLDKLKAEIAVEDELWTIVMKVFQVESVEPMAKLPSSSDKDTDEEAGYLQDDMSVPIVARPEAPAVMPKKGGSGKQQPRRWESSPRVWQESGPRVWRDRLGASAHRSREDSGKRIARINQ